MVISDFVCIISNDKLANTFKNFYENVSHYSKNKISETSCHTMKIFCILKKLK